MAIIAIYDVEGGTAAKYDEGIRRLGETGEGVPDGQLYHVCYGDVNSLQVIEVFEDHAKMEAFGAKLAPILQDLGISVKPRVFDVYNIINTP